MKSFLCRKRFWLLFFAAALLLAACAAGSELPSPPSDAGSESTSGTDTALASATDVMADLSGRAESDPSPEGESSGASMAESSNPSEPSNPSGSDEPSKPSNSSEPDNSSEPNGVSEPSGDASSEISAETSMGIPILPQTPSEKARSVLAGMTLEEKVYQLFIVTPDALTDGQNVTAADGAMRDALANYPVAGLIFFKRNVKSKQQITEMIARSQSYSRLPLLIGVDEEGGRVSRLSSAGITTKFDPMAAYGKAGDAEAVRSIGRTLGKQLRSVGFNVDFAPVADVITNPKNTEIGDRSFSTDPRVAATMVAAMVEGLQEQGTISCVKHFPGHGSTEADSHKGMSVTNRTLEELRETELLPFRAGIGAGTEMVMISHMSAPNVTGNDLPCDLSGAIVTELLRGELGFSGVVVTDSHGMGAITTIYGCGQAAVMAIEAGCDIVLTPQNLQQAANAVLDALNSGRLTEERIDESVLRILTMKCRRGLIG